MRLLRGETLCSIRALPRLPMVPTSWRLLGFYAEAISNLCVRQWPRSSWVRALGGGMRGGRACEDACLRCERCYGCRFGPASDRVECGGWNGDASVFHLTDDSQVAANQPGCGHEARRYLHLREPGEPGAAQSDHCGSQQQNQDGLARADRACNG